MTESLGFLLGDVSRLMRKRFDERARLVGSSRAQWKTLLYLSRNEGLNQGSLAELLEVEPITVCRMIDRLEEAGLVERRRDPADRRAWRIYMTEAAQPVLDELRGYADEMIETMMHGVSSRDRETLIASLEAMRLNLSNLDTLKEAANG